MLVSIPVRSEKGKEGKNTSVTGCKACKCERVSKKVFSSRESLLTRMRTREGKKELQLEEEKFAGKVTIELVHAVFGTLA